MIIDRLPALPSAPAPGDELPIERGTGAYKIDYNALASAIIAQTQRDIAIVVEGNKTTYTGGAAVGQYVIVHNSTISGIADGLYTATQAIPQNTAITSAYLAAVDGGGLNDVRQSMINNRTVFTGLLIYDYGNYAWVPMDSILLNRNIELSNISSVVIPNIVDITQYKSSIEKRANGLYIGFTGVELGSYIGNAVLLNIYL